MLPHSGSMCLIDYVQHWNNLEITCETLSHCRLDNPLRRNEILEAINGIEYAAQTMALHIGLTHSSTDSERRIGYLGALKETTFYVDRLDTYQSAIKIEASQVLSQGLNFIYAFSLTANTALLLKGRASVFVQPSEAHR